MPLTNFTSLNAGQFEVAQLTSAQLQFEKVARLQAPQHEVFTALADHQQWPRLFPWVQSVSVDNSQALVPNGLGARRICHFGPNLVLEELIVGWHPPYAYAYAGIEENHPFGMQGHVAAIICQPEDEQTMTLTWQHYFEHSNLAAMLRQLDGTMMAVFQNLTDLFGGQTINTYLTQRS